MGFSVTASQVILLVAAFGAGSVFAGAVLGALGDVDSGYREAWHARGVAVHSNVTIVDDATWPEYDAANDRFKVRAWNNGSVVIEVSALTFVLDGAYATDLVEQTDVDGDTATDLFLPGETLEVWFNPVTTAPQKFKIVTANGATAYWRS